MIRYPWLIHLLGVLALFTYKTEASEPLQDELVRKSRAGLALAIPSNQGDPALRIRFFDRQVVVIPIECCRLPSAINISYNRIVAVELPSSILFSGRVIGGPVVEMDANGKTIGRSLARVAATAVFIAPNGKRVAFIGWNTDLRGIPISFGLQVVEMDSSESRRLTNVATKDQTATQGKTVDWAPDSKYILFSDGAEIYIVDPETGKSEKIADGHDARWSPNGDQIVYLTSRQDVMLMDVRSRNATHILAGHEIISPPVWSPDGAYLAFGERHYTISPCLSYGRLQVYRTSDGALAPIECFGIQGPHAQWIQLVRNEDEMIRGSPRK